MKLAFYPSNLGSTSIGVNHKKDQEAYIMIEFARRSIRKKVSFTIEFYRSVMTLPKSINLCIN